jgi:hypothetical protein
MEVFMLTTVEKAITERIVSTALNAGLLVGAYADDSADIEPTSSLADILDSAFSYDCVDLILQSKNEQIGFISLNYFNDGLDIISDYSTVLSKFMDGISFKKLSIDL